MRYQASDQFLKGVRKLPLNIQQKLAKLLPFILEDHFHPKLHTKQLSGSLDGCYSFRISRDWRAVFIFLDDETIQLLRVKHRKDVYR